MRTERQTDNDKNNRPNGVMGKGLIHMVTVFPFYNIMQKPVIGSCEHHHTHLHKHTHAHMYGTIFGLPPIYFDFLMKEPDKKVISIFITENVDIAYVLHLTAPLKLIG